MRRRVLLLVVLAVVLGGGGLPLAVDAGAPATAESAGSTIGFRSRSQLVEHYRKHGAEFGKISQAEYLRLAQQLRDRPRSADVLEVIRSSDGVVTRFERSSGCFIAFNRDLTIRTFFRPRDGEAYFRRQARAESMRPVERPAPR